MPRFALHSTRRRRRPADPRGPVIPSLFDDLPPPRSRANAPETSRRAARAMLPRVGTLRYQTMQAIASAPEGLTADEVAEQLEETVLAIRPRVSELHEALWIRDSERRGENDSGHSAVVWIATDEGRRALLPDGAA